MTKHVPILALTTAGALLALAAQPVLAEPAQAQAGTAVASTAASEKAKEKKICRAEANTGSIMPKRVCHTQAEWAEIEAASNQALDTTRQARQRTGIGAGGL